MSSSVMNQQIGTGKGNPYAGFEYPSSFTSRNEVTGDAIRSKGTNQSAYAEGWDRIFGKKKKGQQDEEAINNSVDDGIVDYN